MEKKTSFLLRVFAQSSLSLSQLYHRWSVVTSSVDTKTTTSFESSYFTLHSVSAVSSSLHASWAEFLLFFFSNLLKIQWLKDLICAASPRYC